MNRGIVTATGEMSKATMLNRMDAQSGLEARADESEGPKPNETWDEHYRDERDAAYLYRALADVERTPRLKDLFQKLAAVEDKHTQRWEELFRVSGRPLPAYQTAGRTRLLAWAARWFGTS